MSEGIFRNGKRKTENGKLFFFFLSHNPKKLLMSEGIFQNGKRKTIFLFLYLPPPIQNRRWSFNIFALENWR